MQIRELRDYVISEFFDDDDKQRAFKDISLALLKHYPYHRESPIYHLERHPFTRNVLGVDFIEANEASDIGEFLRQVVHMQAVRNSPPTGLIIWRFIFNPKGEVNYHNPQATNVADIFGEVIFGDYDGLLVGGKTIGDYTYDGVMGFNVLSRQYAFLAEMYRLPVYYHDVPEEEAGPMLARLRKYKEKAYERLLCR